MISGIIVASREQAMAFSTPDPGLAYRAEYLRWAKSGSLEYTLTLRCIQEQWTSHPRLLCFNRRNVVFQILSVPRPPIPVLNDSMKP